VATGVYVFGTVVFVLFARTSIQPWNTYWEINKDHIKEDPDDQTPLLEHKIALNTDINKSKRFL
jgi:Icc-related predicted phosphoesterase